MICKNTATKPKNTKKKKKEKQQTNSGDLRPNLREIWVGNYR